MSQADYTARIERIAKRVVATRYPTWGMLDREDMQQELLVLGLRRAATMSGWSDADIASAFYRRLKEILDGESKHRQRITPDQDVDTSWYTADTLAILLPYVFDDAEAATANPIDAYRDYHDPWLMIAMVTDARSAYYSLDPRSREVVAYRHRDGLTFTEIGRLTGQTEGAPRARYARAMNRMLRILHGEPSAFVRKDPANARHTRVRADLLGAGKDN